MSTTMSLPVRASGRQQHDLYDLPLSTTPAAAEQFREAQLRLLRVQTGVVAPLQRAVALDPDFALGHAMLALVGHDLDLPIEPVTQMRAALGSVSRATARERSFVGAVSARIGSAAGHQSRLLRHLAEHPRDAIALNMAVPTIAFAGAVEVPEQAWALVEAARPVFGSDWWYGGLLAFVRQEQGRFEEADDLAVDALAAEPAAGHAAHALAHVFYETGRHNDGLRWINGWISDNRRTTFQPSHYSWHAALHELRLGDETAVRRRYMSELGSTNVQGVRALIDSASLLWRARIADSWHGELPIDDLLSVVDENMLVAPPTPFVGMHAAIALAARQDVTGLRLLGRHATVHPRAGHRDLVAPFAAAMSALVDGRPHRAAEILQRLMPHLAGFGGSKAQREVVEQTLLYALVDARQTRIAGRLVQQMLDRPTR